MILSHNCKAGERASSSNSRKKKRHPQATLARQWVKRLRNLAQKADSVRSKRPSKRNKRVWLKRKPKHISRLSCRETLPRNLKVFLKFRERNYKLRRRTRSLIATTQCHQRRDQ